MIPRDSAVAISGISLNCVVVVEKSTAIFAALRSIVIASPREIESLGLKMSMSLTVCPLAIPRSLACSMRGISHEPSVGMSVYDVVVAVPVSMLRDFIVIARNSARVIRLLGLKVRSM